MKAILVLDMPKSCSDCPLDSADYGCAYIGSLGECDLNGKSVFCPLKPLPKKEIIEDFDYVNDFVIGRFRGWNDCLDEITGETE